MIDKIILDGSNRGFLVLSLDGYGNPVAAIHIKTHDRAKLRKSRGFAPLLRRTLLLKREASRIRLPMGRVCNAS